MNRGTSDRRPFADVSNAQCSRSNTFESAVAVCITARRTPRIRDRSLARSARRRSFGQARSGSSATSRRRFARRRATFPVGLDPRANMDLSTVLVPRMDVALRPTPATLSTSRSPVGRSFAGLAGPASSGAPRPGSRLDGCGSTPASCAIGPRVPAGHLRGGSRVGAVPWRCRPWSVACGVRATGVPRPGRTGSGPRTWRTGGPPASEGPYPGARSVRQTPASGAVRSHSCPGRAVAAPGEVNTD